MFDHQLHIISDSMPMKSQQVDRKYEIFHESFFVDLAPKSSNDLYTNVDQSIITHLRRLFDQRPIWTRNSLLYHLKITEVILKRIIHHVAYFFCNGPWNRCWVKYGYDPRKDAKAKIYQIVDYRVRAILDPEKNLVKSRTSRAYHRSSFVVHWKISLVNIHLFSSWRLIPGQIAMPTTTISASNTKNYAVRILEDIFNRFDRTRFFLGRNVHVQTNEFASCTFDSLSIDWYSTWWSTTNGSFKWWPGTKKEDLFLPLCSIHIFIWDDDRRVIVRHICELLIRKKERERNIDWSKRAYFFWPNPSFFSRYVNIGSNANELLFFFFSLSLLSSWKRKPSTELFIWSHHQCSSLWRWDLFNDEQ